MPRLAGNFDLTDDFRGQLALSTNIGKGIGSYMKGRKIEKEKERQRIAKEAVAGVTAQAVEENWDAGTYLASLKNIDNYSQTELWKRTQNAIVDNMFDTTESDSVQERIRDAQLIYNGTFDEFGRERPDMDGLRKNALATINGLTMAGTPDLSQSPYRPAPVTNTQDEATGQIGNPLGALADESSNYFIKGETPQTPALEELADILMGGETPATSETPVQEISQPKRRIDPTNLVNLQADPEVAARAKQLQIDQKNGVDLRSDRQKKYDEALANRPQQPTSGGGFGKKLLNLGKTVLSGGGQAPTGLDYYKGNQQSGVTIARGKDETEETINQVLFDGKDSLYGGISPSGKTPEFIQRMTKDSPVITNEDGSVSSHMMAHGEMDGKYIAFPTIIMANGELQQLTMDQAADYAIQNNEYLIFDSEKAAETFAKGSWKSAEKSPQGYTPQAHTPEDANTPYDFPTSNFTVGTPEFNQWVSTIPQSKRKLTKESGQRFIDEARVRLPVGATNEQIKEEARRLATKNGWIM